MPELDISSTSVVKQLYMPSTAALPIEQQGWMKIDMGVDQVGDLLALRSDDPNEVVSRLRLVTSRTKEWNFTNEGTPIPITFENVCHMKQVDLEYLIRLRFGVPEPALSDDDKKK